MHCILPNDSSSKRINIHNAYVSDCPTCNFSLWTVDGEHTAGSLHKLTISPFILIGTFQSESVGNRGGPKTASGAKLGLRRGPVFHRGYFKKRRERERGRGEYRSEGEGGVAVALGDMIGAGSSRGLLCHLGKTDPWRAATKPDSTTEHLPPSRENYRWWTI